MSEFQLLEQRHHIKRKDIYMIMFFDMNAPHSGSKARVKHVANVASWAAAEIPTRSAIVTVMPDIAGKAAKYGVQDDETTFLDEFNGVGLNVDTRFSMWTEREGDSVAGGTNESALPAATFGRLAFHHPKDGSGVKTNAFFANSKLVKNRRPSKIAVMPPFTNILHAESLSADADVFNRERFRALEHVLQPPATICGLGAHFRPASRPIPSCRNGS